MEAIGKFVVGAILAIFGTIARGFVIMKLWAWFMVTTFALPVIGIVQALGLSLVVGLLTHELKMDEDGDDWFHKVVGKFIFVMLIYSIVLLEGYIIFQFM